MADPEPLPVRPSASITRPRWGAPSLHLGDRPKMPAPRVRRLNVRNGMLDLDTLELHTHDPKYLSKVQLPVEWAPDATCPTYEWWVDKLLAPGQRDDRLPDPG